MRAETWIPANDSVAIDTRSGRSSARRGRGSGAQRQSAGSVCDARGVEGSREWAAHPAGEPLEAVGEALAQLLPAVLETHRLHRGAQRDAGWKRAPGVAGETAVHTYVV